MKKWFLTLMALLGLCTLPVIPAGCTSNDATEITGGEEEVPEEGHEEAAATVGNEEGGDEEDG